jgi:two-component system sensor histidine kinase/response regulator
MTEREETYQAASILAVDDDPANLRALAAVLAPLGHQIVFADSVAEVLAITEEQSFAVILMDVRLAVGDDFAVLTALRERLDFATPVIFLSGLGDVVKHTHRAYALGALDYINKPYDPEVLRGKVEALVLLKRRGSELRKRASIISRQSAEMVEQRSEAQASSDRKDRTLSIVSHDLRNPLSSIIVGAALLQQMPGSTPRQQVVATRIARSAKRMELMIHDLLDYARGRFGGGMSVVPKPVDLEEICEAVVAELQVVHPGRKIRLESSGGLQMTCDGGRIEQAVSNLIGNAIEHSATSIDVKATGAEDFVEVEVHNGPPGIPPAKLPIIFEAFRRGDQIGGGLGLGLHIARQIAIAHEGQIEVVSNDVQGTTFTIRLPREPRVARVSGI